jgi:hypothetical protein
MGIYTIFLSLANPMTFMATSTFIITEAIRNFGTAWKQLQANNPKLMDEFRWSLALLAAAWEDLKIAVVEAWASLSPSLALLSNALETLSDTLGLTEGPANSFKQGANAIKDGPAIHIVKQSNIFTKLNEEISGSIVRLDKQFVIPGSEIFTGKIYNYNYLSTNVIKFDSTISDGTISYKYRYCPYNVVASEINVISMTDESFKTYATGTNALTFQAKEAVETLAKKDSSYWAK